MEVRVAAELAVELAEAIGLLEEMADLLDETRTRLLDELAPLKRWLSEEPTSRAG